MRKVLALTTGSEVCQQICDSLSCLGFEVHRAVYSYMADKHESLIEAAKNFAPEFIVYIGGVQPNPQADEAPACPDANTLRQLREFAPTIHICCDAAHLDWWPLLNEYNEKKCFAVQVGVDGNFESPISRYGLVLLKPQDPSIFNPIPWQERTIACSFAGAFNLHDGTIKTKLLQRAQDKGVFLFHSWQRPYQQMVDIMCKTKLTFNVAWRSIEGFHVKWRVIEAGLAGSCLFEQRGAQTEYWFERGRDYLDYDHIPNDPAAAFIGSWHGDELKRRMAERFRAKVLMDHHPSVFWQKVLWRAGIR